MHKLFSAAAVAFLIAGAAIADDVDHYAAKPSDTLEEALANFSEYNNRMAEVLSREDLDFNDMQEIHQLTYTIEVALAKINEESEALAITLEEVHLASEGDSPSRLRDNAEDYLEQAQLLVP